MPSSVTGSHCSVYTCSCSCAESHSTYTCTSCRMNWSPSKNPIIQAELKKQQQRETERRRQSSQQGAGGKPPLHNSEHPPKRNNSAAAPAPDRPSSKDGDLPAAPQALDATGENRPGTGKPAGEPVEKESIARPPRSVASSFTHSSVVTSAVCRSNAKRQKEGGHGGSSRASSGVSAVSTKLALLEKELEKERADKENLKRQVETLSVMQKRLEKVLGVEE